MTQTESTSSLKSPEAANDAVFSNATNTAVNNVVNLAEARERFETLKQANSSSQSLMAWAIDLIRRLTGTESNLSVVEYAGLVALRTQAIAAANDSINPDSQE